MMETTTPTLAPCPVCGGENLKRTRDEIVGSGVECRCGLWLADRCTPAEADAAWNSLAADVARGKVAAKLAAVLRIDITDSITDGEMGGCVFCGAGYPCTAPTEAGKHGNGCAWRIQQEALAEYDALTTEATK